MWRNEDIMSLKKNEWVLLVKNGKDFGVNEKYPTYVISEFCHSLHIQYRWDK